ncbi:MAG: Slp/YeaY family lipoprotein [Paraglaciecola sp.]|nr:Slp/YeaY family lipoprotein [Paraglaciecola sp.]
MNKKFAVIILTMLAVGCSTIPDKIEVPEGTALVSYETAASQADTVKGQTARWGGVIAKVENKAESTLLEVVYYPLRSYGRPVSADESIGRFRVYVQGFMDPMVYKVGRSMTFTGEFVGIEEGLVGEHKYMFPTLQSSAYYLWKEVSEVDISSVHVWPYDYWYGWYPRPYYRGVYIRGSHHAPLPSGSSTKPKPVKVER